MRYFDTSVLVSSLANEPRSAEIAAWLSESAGERCISDWVITEYSAALALKMRVGTLNDAQRRAALRQFTGMIQESFRILPVLGNDFRQAGTFAEREQLGLRAGDALHLAIAYAHDAELVTLDRRLAQAGESLGVASRLL